MKRLLALLLFVALAMPVSGQIIIRRGASCTSTDYNLATSGSSEAVPTGGCFVSKAIVTAPSTLEELSIQIAACHTAGGNECNYVVFNDDGSGSEPGALVAQSGPMHIGTVGAGFHSYTLSGSITTATIWVGVCVENVATTVSRTNTGAGVVEVDTTVTDWSDMSGGWEGTTASNTKHLYATVTVCE